MNEGQLHAASFVSNGLRSIDDVQLIVSLLKVAAGEHVAPRSIDERQYKLLFQHRVLSLVPDHWVLSTPIDVQMDRQARIAQQMLLVEDCRRVSELLSTAGIPARVLKGVATSQLDYLDMSQRTFGDIDMLVLHDDFERAIDVVGQSGAIHERPGALGYEFRKEALLITHSGSEVDLHYRLCISSPHTLPELFEHPLPLDQGGYALSTAGRLAHAASHLMLTPPGMRRLSGLADISAIRARHEVSLDDVRRFARLLDCEALVGFGLRIERELRNLPVDTGDWQQPSRLELASFARPNRQLLMEHAYFVSGIEGSRQKVRYLMEWALPTKGTTARRGGIIQYFRRALPRRFGGQTGGHEI